MTRWALVLLIITFPQNSWQAVWYSVISGSELDAQYTNIFTQQFVPNRTFAREGTLSNPMAIEFCEIQHGRTLLELSYELAHRDGNNITVTHVYIVVLTLGYTSVEMEVNGGSMKKLNLYYFICHGDPVPSASYIAQEKVITRALERVKGVRKTVEDLSIGQLPIVEWLDIMIGLNKVKQRMEADIKQLLRITPLPISVANMQLTEIKYATIHTTTDNSKPSLYCVTYAVHDNTTPYDGKQVKWIDNNGRMKLCTVAAIVDPFDDFKVLYTSNPEKYLSTAFSQIELFARERMIWDKPTKELQNKFAAFTNNLSLKNNLKYFVAKKLVWRLMWTDYLDRKAGNDEDLYEEVVDNTLALIEDEAVNGNNPGLKPKSQSPDQAKGGRPQIGPSRPSKMYTLATVNGIMKALELVLIKSQKTLISPDANQPPMLATLFVFSFNYNKKQYHSVLRRVDGGQPGHFEITGFFLDSRYFSIILRKTLSGAHAYLAQPFPVHFYTGDVTPGSGCAGFEGRKEYNLKILSEHISSNHFKRESNPIAVPTLSVSRYGFQRKLAFPSNPLPTTGRGIDVVFIKVKFYDDKETFINGPIIREKGSVQFVLDSYTLYDTEEAAIDAIENVPGWMNLNWAELVKNLETSTAKQKVAGKLS